MLRKKFNGLLIIRPLCIRSLSKVNDFKTSIQQTYLQNFIEISEALFKLPYEQAHPLKYIFDHVTSLIG